MSVSVYVEVRECMFIKTLKCQALIAQLNTEACWFSQQVLCQEGSGQNVTEPLLPCRRGLSGNRYCLSSISLSLHVCECEAMCINILSCDTLLLLWVYKHCKIRFLVFCSCNCKIIVCVHP